MGVGLIVIALPDDLLIGLIQAVRGSTCSRDQRGYLRIAGEFALPAQAQPLRICLGQALQHAHRRHSLPGTHGE